MDHEQFDNLAVFYYTVESIPHLDEIPLSVLEELDIEMMQKISRSAKFDGLMLILAADLYDKNLIVRTWAPDHQSKPLLPFADSPDSTIYISNDASAEEVIEILHKMSERYDSLNPPPFEKYNHDDGDDADFRKVSVEEFIRGNAVAKYKHELFMRDHGMHNTVIPTNYKRTQLKLIK